MRYRKEWNASCNFLMYPEWLGRWFRRNTGIPFVGGRYFLASNLSPKLIMTPEAPPFTIPPTLRCCVDLLFVGASFLFHLIRAPFKTRRDFRRSLKRHYHRHRGGGGGGKREFGIMYRPATGEMYYSSLWLLMSFLTIRRSPRSLLRAFKCANFDVRILLPLVHLIPLAAALISSLFVSFSNFHKVYL